MQQLCGKVYVGGMLEFVPGFLRPREANAVYTQLHGETHWQQPVVRLFGREIPSPRLAAWYGDDGADYAYSGVVYSPLNWTPLLTGLKSRVEDYCSARFNSVLLNLYRDENDSMGWHADDESELGPTPLIASLSLGASRRFRMQCKKHKYQRLELMLDCGSLLLMRHPCQRDWRHSLPKQSPKSGPCAGRINLTFRQVHAPARESA